ncbi:MAG: hypothetical protein WC364_06365 [Eubacteriales bacterium]
MEDIKLSRLYHIKPRQDSRNPVARTLDSLAGALLFWLFVLTVLLIVLPVYTALCCSLLAALIMCLAGVRFQKWRINKRRLHNRMWLAGEKFRSEIDSLKTRDDLIIFVGLLLERSNQFRDVRVTPKDPAPILSTYRGSKVGIQCLPPALPGDAADPGYCAEIIQQLGEDLEKGHYEKAFIAAAGEIHPHVRWLIKMLGGNYQVALLSKEKLVELAVRAERLSGGEEVPESGVKQKSVLKGTESGIKEIVLARKKGPRYLAAFFMLAVFYLLAHLTCFAAGICLSFIIINGVLALACLIANHEKRGAFRLE